MIAWAAAFVLGCLAVVEIAAHWRWKRQSDRQLDLMRHVEETRKPAFDYIVSISDWGPDFGETELGRWRWVIWEKVREGAPVDVGNDITGQRAWLSVWSAIVRNWDDPVLTPTITVEWKKVTHGDSADS